MSTIIVRTSHNFKVGDQAIIRENKGSGYGQAGDICEIEYIDRNANDYAWDLLWGKLLTGKDIGKISKRYAYRHNLFVGDWDL